LHSPAAFFALLVFFLGLSIFFSASETALMAVSRLRLKYLAETGDKRADFIKRILANPDRALGVILLGNTITNIAAASLVTYLVATYAPTDRVKSMTLLASAALTIVILILCELTPKIIAATHAEELSRRLVWPIQISIWVLSPFAALGAFIANRLVRLAGLSTGTSPFTRALSEGEIRSIIAGSPGAIMAEDQKEMLHNVFEIRDTEVREVMIPRTDVTAVDIDDPLPEILSVFRKTHYSRIPVFQQSFDNIMGILYVKDLLQHMQRPGDIDLHVLLRPVHFVPDTARLGPVLRQMQSMHLHMAVVVDEFGGVEGIITLEDLLEEIVGEIRDEHDTETEPVHELGPSLYSVTGNLPVRDFNRFFEAKIPESREYTTVAGFLQTRTGRLLQAGESVRYQELNFFIDKVDGMKIVLVRVRVPALKGDKIASGSGRAHQT
jgi:putative hemolysin